MTTLGELAARVDALDRRLDATESILAIRALKARYGEVLDARYARGRLVAPDRLADLAVQAAALFTTDAVWDGGPTLGVARGREEIARRLAESTLVFSRHLFVNPRVEIDGDRATGRWELLSPCTRADGTCLWVSGIEHDTYARVDGAWLQSSMTLTTVFAAKVDGGWPTILV